MSKLTRIKRKQATRQDRNLKNTLFTDPKKRRRARMKRLITKRTDCVWQLFKHWPMK